MDITVKIELGTKERKLLEELITRLGELGHGCACSCENPQPEPETPETPKDPTAEPMPGSEEEPAESAPPSVYRDEIRSMMQQYVITDKRDAIKELLKKYGVAKASALPDDKLEDFAVELTKVCEG